MPLLAWLNDEAARRAARSVPYRLLDKDPALSCGDPQTQNMLIRVDNLTALLSNSRSRTAIFIQISCVN